MGEILSFPSQRAQGLNYLDRELRQMLSSTGAERDVIDFAAAELTRIYSELADSEQYQLEINLPPDLDAAASAALYSQIEAGLEELRRENHSLMLKLIAQLVLTEVQLYQQQRSD